MQTLSQKQPRSAARVLCALTLALGLAVSAAAQPEFEPPPADDVEAVTQRILALQREIDELLAALPPEARAEVQRRLAEAPAPAAPAPPVPERSDAPRDAAAAAPPPLERRVQAPPCNYLIPLDTDEDGQVSAFDRYWRHLYLWRDADGDGQAADGEVASLYERGVRQIGVDLETFVREEGGAGVLRRTGELALDGEGVLVVDATRLGRGDGPEVLSPGGEVLAGFQPFRPGYRWRDAAGHVTEWSCR